MNWYYYNQNGEKIGPISTAALKELARQGFITPETKIENQNGRSALAGKVNGLEFSQSPTPPPTPSQPTPAAPSESDNLSGVFNAALKATGATLSSGISSSTPDQTQFTDEEQAEIDKFLRMCGNDVNAVNENGNTALCSAIMQRGTNNFKYDAIIRYLVF